MTYTRLDLTSAESVSRITLNQPDEYNRMPPAFWEEFPRALQEVDSTGKQRVLIVASTGKHFSAGLDVSSFSGGQSDTEPGRRGEKGIRHLANMQDVFTRIERIRMPVIAAVQGGCVGGGVDLISACDMRYCTQDAFFCIQEINIGLAADVGTLQRLPKLIPEGLMRELAYTGRRMFADEALAAGLVNRVFDTQEAMLSAVDTIAREIATKSPLAIASTKHLLNYGREHTIADTLSYQTAWMGAAPQGGDIRKHFTAKAAGGDAEFEDLAPAG